MIPDTMLRLADDLLLPAEAATQKFALFGQSGSGKSYAAMKLAEEMLRAGIQVIILDSVGIWWGLRVAADGTGPGLPIAVCGGEHGDLPLPASAASAIAEALAEGGMSAVLDISEYELPDHKRFVRDFAEAFFQAKKKRRTPVHLFFEEAQVCAPMNPDRDETTMLNRVERLARIGRNYGIGWTIVSQRPQDVHTKVRNQAGTLLALRTIGTHERKAITEWVADKARTRDEASLSDRLPELPTGTAVVWSPAWLRTTATVAILPRATFDSSATPTVGQEARAPRALADVDLDRLRALLSVVTDEAVASDIPTLRARIADLERQLRAQPTPPPERITERVEVPVLGAADLAALGKIARSFRETIDEVQVALNRTRDTVEGQMVALRAGLRADFPPDPALAQAVQPVPALTPAPPARPVAAAHSSERQALPSPQQRILDALAEFVALGLTSVARANVATWSGQSPKSSAYDAHLRALRDAGLVATTGQTVVLLSAGERLARRRQQPPSLAALHEAWGRRLPDPQARMVAVLVRDHPTPASREYLAQASRQSVTSSAFDAHLRALRDLGLVAWPRGGDISATTLLFPPGLV